MSNRSRYEWYCVLVCIVSVVAIVIFGGRSILYGFYYFNPDSGLNPVYKLDYEDPFPHIEFPPIEFLPELAVEISDAERLERRKQKYEYDLIQYKYDVGLLFRQSFIYSLLFVFIFIGHFQLLRHDKKKET